MTVTDAAADATPEGVGDPILDLLNGFIVQLRAAGLPASWGATRAAGRRRRRAVLRWAPVKGVSARARPVASGLQTLSSVL